MTEKWPLQGPRVREVLRDTPGELFDPSPSILGVQGQGSGLCSWNRAKHTGST